jgi:hypothetical protein
MHSYDSLYPQARIPPPETIRGTSRRRSLKSPEGRRRNINRGCSCCQAHAKCKTSQTPNIGKIVRVDHREPAVEHASTSAVTEQKEPAVRYRGHHLALGPTRLVEKRVFPRIEHRRQPFRRARSRRTGRHDDARLAVPASRRQDDHRPHLHHLRRTKPGGEIAEKGHAFRRNERDRWARLPHARAANATEYVALARRRKLVDACTYRAADNRSAGVQLYRRLMADSL